ncbi:hypothetical protein RHO15_10055 [Utexia brackfieldae]|uniref:ATP-binding protein n=1 Tax=Utexia brackfieldae TaxID=3074108 RepID=UPI00370D0713
MYLSSFAMTEPDDNLHMYYPSWFNAWESHMYNLSLKSTQANAWAFKRFGMSKTGYVREILRKPDIKAYIDAMNEAAEIAFNQLTDKTRMALTRSRTAFIYTDAWGESGVFEAAMTPLSMTTINTAPRLLIQKFSARDFSCKVRSEKQSLMQAMIMADQYLAWDVFDFVVICSAFRAVPVLVFSEEDRPIDKQDKAQYPSIQTNICIERVGCFVFSQRESELEINCGEYIMPDHHPAAYQELLGETTNLDWLAYAGLRKNRHLHQQLIGREKQGVRTVDLVDVYGASGHLSPALSWIYLQQQNLTGKMRTIVPDNFGGYHYFDSVCSDYGARRDHGTKN